MRYEQLQPEDRVTLASLHQQGWSIRAIARYQGHSPSTISRELRRNACHGSYASEPAQRLGAIGSGLVFCLFHFGLGGAGRNARSLRDSEQRQRARNHFSTGA